MKFLLIFFFLLSYTFSFGQLEEFKLTQYDSLQKEHSKSSIVFIHTDWCKYCKQLKNTTLQDSNIQKKMKEFGYYFDLNAEEKNSISINNVEFYYKPTGNNTGSHELAEELGSIDGKLEYPTLVFLNEKHEIIHQIVGFITVKEFTETINRIAKN